MSDKSWKRAERNVAKKLNGERNPLSGRMGGHTSGDVIHDKLYVEVKQRSAFSVLSIMRHVQEEAKKENKLPVLVLHQRGARKRYYLIEESFFLTLLESHLQPQSPPAPSA